LNDDDDNNTYSRPHLPFLRLDRLNGEHYRVIGRTEPRAKE